MVDGVQSDDFSIASMVTQGNVLRDEMFFFLKTRYLPNAFICFGINFKT